jgi:hypothetical protein
MLERLFAPKPAPVMAKPATSIPLTLRVARWLAPHLRVLVVEQIAPRIPARVYTVAIAVGALLTLLILFASIPQLRVMALLGALVAGGIGGYWRARSRRWVWAAVIGAGAAWALWCFAIAPVPGLVVAGLLAAVFLALGIERGREVDPGALPREWRALTAPGEPLASVLGGSRLRFAGREGDQVSYTLTLRAGRTIDQVFKIRAAVESAVDEALAVRRNTLQLLADHDRPAVVHVSFELFKPDDLSEPYWF